MRKYLISAAALTFLAVPPAWADPPEGHGNRGHGEQQEHGGPPPGQAGRPAGQMGHEDRGRGPAPQAAMQPQRVERENRAPAPQMAVQAPPNRGEQNRDFNRGERDRGQMENRAPQMAIQAPANRGDQNRDFRNRAPTENRAPQMAIQAPTNRDQTRDSNRMGFDRQGPDNRSAFNNNRGGQRHDFRAFRDFHRDFRAPHRFNVSSYRRPSGWYSHRWAFGEFLPTAFWARDYWLIDFAVYDLPPPPYGAVWVRVDSDALLIDEDSGEIITVVYDVFY
jgi:Ni/Co efflux regulator RcnB